MKSFMCICPENRSEAVYGNWEEIAIRKREEEKGKGGEDEYAHSP